MAFQLGNKAQVSVQAQDLSAYCSDVKLPIEFGAIETTTFGATAKTFIPGIGSAKISVTGRFDPAADALIQPLVGTSGAFVVGPMGTTTGNPKYTGTAILTKYEMNGQVEKEIGFTLELQVSGPVTRTVY